MSQYILRRLMIAIPSLLGISVVLFVVLALAPGDPFSELATNPNVPPEVQAALRAKFGLTMVFISHDLSVVRVLCDDVAILQHGQIVEYGPVAQIFSSPQHPYTKQLLSAIPLPDVEPGWLNSNPVVISHQQGSAA